MSKLKTAMMTVVLAFLFTLSGCAAVDYAKQNPEQASMAVKAGTLAFIEQVEPISNRVDRAKEVIVVVEMVLDQMDSSASATVSSLSSEVRSEIDWNSMDAYERLLLDSLIASVERRLEDRIGSGILGEDERLIVKSVLEWAKDAADMYAEGEA